MILNLFLLVLNHTLIVSNNQIENENGNTYYIKENLI